MKYDFDTFINRENTYSTKWNYIKEQVGEEDALPMWIADMDFETVPEIKEAIISRARHGIYGYTVRSNEYYQTLVDWNNKKYGWKIKKEWITHSTGVVNAIYNTISALTSPGDGIIIQSPVYHPFYSVIEKSGRKLILNPLKNLGDRYVPDFEDLESKLKEGKAKLFVLCNPHNPVGRVYTREEITTIGELCLKYKVKVISDEIHSDLVYKEYKHIPFASISREFEQNSIICTAPSKTFNLAGLSTSNIIIPNEELRNKYNDVCEVIGLKAFNIFGAIACEAAYKHGEEWLSQVIDYIEGNKNYALDYIKKRIPQIKIYEPEATYFLWIDCRGLGLDKNDLEKFMIHEAKLWLNQGYIFGTEGEGFIRVNIACQRSTLEEALKRLENAIIVN